MVPFEDPALVGDLDWLDKATVETVAVSTPMAAAPTLEEFIQMLAA